MVHDVREEPIGSLREQRIVASRKSAKGSFHAERLVHFIRNQCGNILDSRGDGERPASSDGLKKTYFFPGDFIDGYHRWLSRCPRDANQLIKIGIDGWLFPADALKLYEMAFFCDDILEVGTFKGLSTTIMAQAIFNSGRESTIVTCDLDPVYVAEARIGFQLRQVPDRSRHQFIASEGTAFVRDLASTGKKFSFAFIDHSHCYEHVLGVCEHLADVLVPGSFCLFHDYNDPRNLPGFEGYGVYQGVRDGLPPELFDFFGIFGCTGLYRRK
jgi:SAM-dependent methyltransferase